MIKASNPPKMPKASNFYFCHTIPFKNMQVIYQSIPLDKLDPN